MSAQDDELVALTDDEAFALITSHVSRFCQSATDLAIFRLGQANSAQAQEIAELREELAAAKMGEPEDMVRALQPLAAWVATLKPQLEKAEAELAEAKKEIAELKQLNSGLASGLIVYVAACDQEIAELRASVASLADANLAHLERAEKAEAALAEARQDAERLDYLERSPRLAEIHIEGEGVKDCYLYGISGAPGLKLREIIDAARTAIARGTPAP